MQWMYAGFGMLLILVGILGVWMMILDGSHADWGTVVSWALLLVFIGVGVWLAWPILVACKDLISGTRHAGEIIRTRESSSAADRHRWLSLYNTIFELLAIALAAVVPLLWWGMRRREPDSRRHWVVLFVGLTTGYVVLIHRGVHIWPGNVGSGRIELPLQRMLAGRETPLTLWIGYEIIWLSLLAGSNWTGLPVGGWTAFFAPLAFLPFLIGYYLHYPLWKQFLLWFLSVALGFIFNAIREVENEFEVTKRSRRAREISRRLLGTDPRNRPRFALYLRPFASTGNLDTQQREPLDLETVLSYAVRPELLLLGLNRPQDKAIIGADYLYGADQDWFTRFQRLANNATLIFLLPSSHSGTLEEVAWLVEARLFQKCIFLMPETVTGSGIQGSSFVPSTVTETDDLFIDHAPEWEDARRAVSEKTKLRLPEYQEYGAVFTMDDSGVVRRLEALRLSRFVLKVVRLRRAIKRVLRPLSLA
jgi:hypothetical protein